MYNYVYAFIPVCIYKCKYSVKETSSQKKVAVITTYIMHQPALTSY